MEEFENIKSLSLEEYEKIPPENIGYITLTTGEILIVNGLDHNQFNLRNKGSVEWNEPPSQINERIKQEQNRLSNIEEDYDNERNSNQIVQKKYFNKKKNDEKVINPFQSKRKNADAKVVKDKKANKSYKIDMQKYKRDNLGNTRNHNYVEINNCKK